MKRTEIEMFQTIISRQGKLHFGQECIPVRCVPSAAVVILREVSA